jgi:glycine cleavage system H protein
MNNAELLKINEMDFSYSNIFETKGIEYFVIIGFLLLIIPFWFLLNRPLKIQMNLQHAFGVLTGNVLRIPQGLFYSKNHTWTHLGRKGNAKVGLNDLLVHLTGTVQFNNLKSVGEKVTKGEIMAEIMQNGKLLKIASPISGKIEGVNTDLNENPAVLNDDPYEKGWIYNIIPETWKQDTNSYLLANEATQWLNMELDRFKDFIAITMSRLSPEMSMVVLQEGGELSDNPLSEMPNEVWREFQNQFLDTVS